jgi:hypothetical protein
MENALAAKEHISAISKDPSACPMEDLDGALRICTKSTELLQR